MATQLSATGAGGGTTASPPPPPPTVYLSDHFTGADGTNLTAHAMDVGPGWTALAGTAVLSGGKAVPSVVTSGLLYTSDSGHSDATASVTEVSVVVLDTETLCALLFRLSDASNMWLVDADIIGGNLRLIKTVAGSASVAQESAQTLVSGVANSISVTYSGPSITVYLDGVSIFTVNDAFNQAATICGLVVNTNSDTVLGSSSWDDFLVTA